ncbi:beta-1,6-N-acetylglucosaminyltransferase [Priestia megaterium]|uniref:beta-1,6-N-acetylglucosaminyltransferase n=1 Tax=Priestia megaterium TaxID=1404 RepID=UPI003672AB29
MKKIAYLLLVHDNPLHLKRLVNTLDLYADFYIHVDSKSDISDFKNEFRSKKNVYFVQKRFPVFWGGFNMIEATKELLRSATLSRTIYKRLVLLSGVDYPLISNKKIHEFFHENNTIEYIRGFDVTNSENRHYLKQIKKYYLMDMPIPSPLINRVLKKLFQLTIGLFNFKKPFIKIKNKKFDVFFGSQWWAITPECANEMLRIIDENKDIDHYFKYSFAPDEKYFHTVFFNSSFRDRTLENGPGVFSERGTWRWANIHHIHPSLSKWYSVSDCDEVFASKKLFIRKVNTANSEKLLDIIDKQIQQES